jgi:CheY-like chemotaxis protein
MAPEIAFCKEVDPHLRSRADVYSLACVAYQLFTGRLPFDSTSNIGVLLQHAMTPVVPPSSLRPDLPAEMDRILLRALAKEPRERTPTVDEFRRDLIALSQGAEEPVRILVAEDDDDFRQALSLFLALKFPNAEIECVRDGAGALEAVDRKTPSVAIVDLRMPEIDGLELTRRLRERPSSRAIPIIILTACGGSEEWRRLAALGANRFLVKPVVLDDLVVLVRRVLSERPSGVVFTADAAPVSERSTDQALTEGGSSELLVS